DLGFDLGWLLKTDKQEVNASLETKYDFAQYGFSTGLKWTTDSDLLTEIVVDNKSVADGLRVSFNGKWPLVTGQKTGAIKTLLQAPSYSLNADLDFETSGAPRFTGAAVYK